MTKENIDHQKDLSDNELIQIVREKDIQKYAEIIDRYQGKLFAYLYRLVGSRQDAQDLLQDVFIKAYQNLYSYDTKRKFSSWIYRIAHNEAVNYIKRKSLKRFIPWESVIIAKDRLEMSSATEEADEILVRKEIRREVNETMDKLPFKYKQVLILRYYSDKSYREISEILGRPINTVGTLINRAKKKLLTELKKNNKRNQK